MTRKQLILALSLGVGMFILAGASVSLSQSPSPVQPPTPPQPPSPVTAPAAPLSADEKQMADQYIDAIQQLENTIDDYVIYFEKFDHHQLKQYGVTFESFRLGLESGSYSENPEKLAKDLEKYIEHLRENEAQLRGASSKSDAKLYRLFKNLRRELSVILDIVDDAISQRPAPVKFDPACQEYIEQVIKDNNVRIARVEQEPFASQYEMALKVVQKSLDELSDKSRQEALKSLSDLKSLKDLKIQLDSNQLPELTLEQQKAVLKALESVKIDLTRKGEPVIVFTDKTPEPTSAPEASVTGNGQSGATAVDERARSFTGSLGISSNQMPIYVTHPRGELEVSGWNNSTVSAKLYVVVDAPTKKDRDDFLQSVRLKMGQDKDGYYAETVFPSLSNPNTRVTKSILKIQAPATNRIICNHSYGDVTVERFEDGALIKGNNSTITASEINGRLKIENSLGAVSVDRIEGRLQITNNSGQIFITDCSVDARISNTAELVSVSDSKGDFSIVNSGPISIVDHKGDLDIENYNGAVNILDVTGSVAAYNTLQPLVVRNIIGDVTLENRNADIQAYQISDFLTATTSHANIDAGSLGSQFELNNEHGNIKIEMDGSPSKTSKVTATSGQIWVVVPSGSNLLMDAIAEDGNIDSEFPMDLSGDGKLKQARITVGKGTNRLNLKTIHGSIKISEL